jgi:hypothetical protein
MQKKRRNGRASTKMSVEDEIAHLRGLDLGGLRSRWHSVFQRQAPAHLTRHLLFAVSLTRSDSIRNNFGAGPRSRMTVAPKVGIASAKRSDASSRLSRRERNFWMRRQGAQNRR